MELARFLHGRPDARTGGATLTHGRGYEAFTEAFFLGRRRAVYDRLARLSGARPGDRVLDVGCGTGYLSRRMADQVTSAGSVLGVDPSPDLVAHARRLTADTPHCRFTDGIAEQLPTLEGPYDVVVTSLVVHHLPEEVRALALDEMFRVLRPGGRVLVADFRPPQGRVGRHLVGAVTGPTMEHNPVHLLEPLVRGAGFTDIAVDDLRPWMRCVRGTKPETAQ